MRHVFLSMRNFDSCVDSDELMAVYMKAVEDGDSVGQIIYGRLIAMT